MSNDGRENRVLILTGTAPIDFKGARYNIPVEMYVLPTHPVVPPQAFVRPTQSMMVKPNHRHVGSDGMIYLPYLNSWGQGSNLVDLLKIMSEVFSADPPLFARPPIAGTGVSDAAAVHASRISHGSAVSAGASVRGTGTGSDYNAHTTAATATATALSSSGSGAVEGSGNARGGAVTAFPTRVPSKRVMHLQRLPGIV